LYHRDSYDSRLWILEKIILNQIYVDYIKKTIKYYLDFACGTGRILEIFEDKAINSFGIDISDDMLKQAKLKYKKTNFLKNDLSKHKNLIDKKFNVITAFRFFLNAEESLRSEILKVFYNILEDEGILIFNNHGNKYSMRLSSLLLNFLLNFKWNLKSLSILEIKKLLIQNNFKIIKTYSIGYIPSFLTKIIPRNIWLYLEKKFMKLNLLKSFGIDMIFICKKVKNS